LLRDAVAEIQAKRRQEALKKQRMLERKREMRRLDLWLGQVEAMLEEDRRTVPEPVIKEIASFLRGLDPKLHRSLLRNREREASRVLDVLFDAQETLLPFHSEVA
jgi:hypothetical protein